MVRFVPKVIDYAIFAAQVAVLFGYLYMAYLWNDFTTVCHADVKSDVPLGPASNITGVNVNSYFKMAVRWGFWMSFLTFMRAILAQVGLCLKRWVLLWCSYVLFAANISISIVLFVLMNVWRWSHSGKVCSGDYLDDKDSADPDIYLIKEGKFIKIMLIIIYVIFILSLTSIMIVSICIYRRHSQEDNALHISDKNMGSGVSSRQTAFTKALDPDYEAAMRESSRSEMKKKFFPPEQQTH